MKQLLLISCVAGVCWASDDDGGYGSLSKVEQSDLFSMSRVQKVLPVISFNSGIKKEDRNFYVLKNGVQKLISKDQIYCQLKDQPGNVVTIKEIEQLAAALNDAYGNAKKVKELKEKYDCIMPFVSSFCMQFGLTTFNENCLYSGVNCWNEFHEERDEFGESVIYLIKDSKDSPRVLSPHPMPETPHEEDQFFDFDMEIGLE